MLDALSKFRRWARKTKPADLVKAVMLKGIAGLSCTAGHMKNCMTLMTNTYHPYTDI